MNSWNRRSGHAIQTNAGIRLRGAGSNPGRASSSSLNPAVSLIVLLVLGIGLGVIHNRLKAQGRADPVLSVVRAILFPAQKGASYVRGGLSFNFEGLIRGRELEAENTRLAAENARLTLENQNLRLQTAEVTSLRATLHLSQQNKGASLTADILGWLPTAHFESILIGRGTRDGIREKMVVRTADGLLGQVVDTGPTTAVVMLLTDLNSGVGGLVKRDGKTLGTGIVQGMGRIKPLEVQSLKREDDIKPGDIVVSSGYGGVYPPDIPIGVVTDVLSADGSFLKKALVAPFAPQPGDLREVLVLQ